MTSIEVTIRDAILSSACLDTYTRDLSDLCRAYNLPVPDLTQVHQYNRPNTPNSIKSEGSDLDSEPDDNQDTTPVAILCHEETNYE